MVRDLVPDAGNPDRAGSGAGAGFQDVHRTFGEMHSLRGEQRGHAVLGDHCLQLIHLSLLNRFELAIQHFPRYIGFRCLQQSAADFGRLLLIMGLDLKIQGEPVLTTIALSWSWDSLRSWLAARLARTNCWQVGPA